LVAQIKEVVGEIQGKYGHIPKVRNLANMILNSLGLVVRIIFCVFKLIFSNHLY